METNLSNAIDITSETAKYDDSVKEVLADKQVLARILKYTLEEFKDIELEEIMRSMDEPVISGVRVEPGQTNFSKVEKRSEEDNVPGEGKIFYDIRFVVYLRKEMFKILINIEAQKTTNEKSLGYHLDNRVIYYLARMISAQKEVEFINSNYDDIKSVRSIWICMDAKADEDSINRIRFTQENVYGKMMELPNIDKVQGIIIRLRSREDVETSKNYLIAMLEELLRKEKAEVKKKKLEKEYGFVMNEETERRVNVMCNLSEVMIEKGVIEGRTEGEDLKIIELVCKKMQKGKTVAEITEDLEESESKIEKIYKVALKYNAKVENKEEIYKELK